MSAAHWQGLFTSQMLASPWLELLTCHANLSMYTHTHTLLCQMDLVLSCLLRSHESDPARATLTGGTSLAPVWTRAPAFFLHPGSSTTLGPFAVTMKYISEHLNNVRRAGGFCLLFPDEWKFNRSHAFLILVVLLQVATWFSGYVPAHICATLSSDLCLKSQWN